MKKGNNILLVAALTLMLIGLALFVVDRSKDHRDPLSFDITPCVLTSVDVEDSFREISVSATIESISFLPSADGGCRVEFLEPEKVEPSARVVNGTLTIGTTQPGNILEIVVSSLIDTPTITVYLPADDYDNLKLESDTGSVTLPEDFSFGSIELVSDTGSINCSASARQHIRVKSDTGAIRLSGLSAGELDLSTDTGAVELDSVICAGPITIREDTGKTMLRNVNCGSLDFHGCTGLFEMKDLLSTGLIAIEQDTGPVLFERCDASELRIKTSTGKVVGSLLTEKVFNAKSDTGKVEVPNMTSGGSCTITTDTGKIQVTVG